MSRHRALVALGANLGDRLATFRDAICRLDADDEISVEAVSALYETVPVGGPEGQQPYYNAAVGLATDLAPAALLGRLQAIEGVHRRVRTEAWGPRTLDLDLLLFDEATLSTPTLTVPHPRLHERRFVLTPLADIAAGVVHPVLGRTVQELLAALPDDDIDDVVPIAKEWR